jgi:hypothetical protein
MAIAALMKTPTSQRVSPCAGQVNTIWKCKVKSVNSEYTELPTVAELTPDGGGPRLKTTAHTRFRAVATALGSANDSQGDGRADGEMERAKVEERGRIWPTKL